MSTLSRLAKSFWITTTVIGVVVIAIVLGRFATPIPGGFLATKTPVTSGESKTSASSKEKIKIRWLVDNYGILGGSYPQLPAREKVVADFNASQDEIELVIELVDDLHIDTWETMIAYGTAPDIVTPPVSSAHVTYGQWLDLTPYIESTGFDTSIYNPALTDLYQIEEGQVGLPFQVFPSAIYYVPAMFDKAGLAYPPKAYGEKYTLDGTAVDWSWDTLAEVAKRLTIDVNGKNATEAGFDATQIVQIGFSPQWQTHVAYQASYIAGAADIVEGEEGNYTSAIPDSWKEANKWVYDGMWGEQPFIATGLLASDPEFGNGNLFGSGKAAMALSPLWYACCLEAFRDAGFEFDAGVMPVGADGQIHGRVDGDTFRIWKGTPHPEEAFKALAYLIGPEGIQTLLLGGDEVAPDSIWYGLPANPEFQQPYIDDLLEKYPFTTAETWDVFLAGLSYPDTPSAEQWQPNWSEAWAREQAFFDLIQNTPLDRLEFDAEWQKMVDDLNQIYGKCKSLTDQFYGGCNN